MAFLSKDISVLAYANGFTLWHYKTTDQASDVDTTGYFNLVSELMRVGDMILANVNTGSVPQTGIFVVTGNAGGVVDAANLTRFDSTNSD